MRTPEQGRWDFVQQWLDKAHRDLRAAALLLRDDVQDYENTGFHAQQAAEKFLKAFLVCYQIEFPKTHNIAQLRQLIEQREPALAERLAHPGRDGTGDGVGWTQRATGASCHMDAAAWDLTASLPWCSGVVREEARPGIS
jgi:hypothetical protein